MAGGFGGGDALHTTSSEIQRSATPATDVVDAARADIDDVAALRKLCERLSLDPEAAIRAAYSEYTGLVSLSAAAIERLDSLVAVFQQEGTVPPCVRWKLQQAM